MKNTCATCHYWQHIRDEDFENWPGPHGECELFDEDSQNQLAWTTGIEIAHPHLYAVDINLITKPGFGCNQWVEQGEKS